MSFFCVSIENPFCSLRTLLDFDGDAGFAVRAAGAWIDIVCIGL